MPDAGRRCGPARTRSFTLREDQIINPVPQPQPIFAADQFFRTGVPLPRAAPGPPVAYDLRDEWRVDTQQPQAMQFLCAPCMKQHLGITYPVVDTVTHYAVYPITPVSETFVPFIRDQFMAVQQLVYQYPLEYLFVPSEKTDLPTDTKKDTWGRLKQMYR